MTAISFSNQELQALMQLLDLAVKAGGLQAATPAVVIQQKIMAAVQEASVQQPVEE